MVISGMRDRVKERGCEGESAWEMKGLKLALSLVSKLYWLH